MQVKIGFCYSGTVCGISETSGKMCQMLMSMVLTNACSFPDFFVAEGKVYTSTNGWLCCIRSGTKQFRWHSFSDHGLTLHFIETHGVEVGILNDIK